MNGFNWRNESMGFRRVFIIRKDLHLSPGKLSAMVGHCAEAYWTNQIRSGEEIDYPSETHLMFQIIIEKDAYEKYICDRFVKTVCEARNKNHLLKARTMAAELGMVENEDFGLIYDACLTELTAEEENGTTLVGIWFKPLPDEVIQKISKKYQLYNG